MSYYNFPDGPGKITHNCNNCNIDLHLYKVKRVDIYKYECLWCEEVHTGVVYNDGDRDRIVLKKDTPSWLLTGDKKYEEV